MGAFEQLFGPVRGDLNKNFPKIQIPGGMLKLPFDWYITNIKIASKFCPLEPGLEAVFLLLISRTKVCSSTVPLPSAFDDFNNVLSAPKSGCSRAYAVREKIV